MSTSNPDYQDREQSEIKHYALRLYLEAATRILGSSRNLKYVDCCAGPWKSQSNDYMDTSFGIAVDVLYKTAAELATRKKSHGLGCLLIEEQAGPFQELQEFASKRDGASVKVTARNWDFTQHISKIVTYCTTPNTFPFIFIDPTGWKLAGISRIAPLLQLNPGEVLINLMSSFISRFLKDNKIDFTDLLGEDFPELRKLSGLELEFEVVRKYCDLVKRTGAYKYVCALPVMKPDSDTFNFYLIYATRHPKGVTVFKDVERRTEERTHIVRADVQQRARELRTGNRELFGAAIQYHESSYQRLASENGTRAKAAVLRLLATGEPVSYDDCWAEALQMPAVYQSDLREWLTEWEQEGSVVVAGRKTHREVLKIGSGHSIQLRQTSTGSGATA